MKLLLAVFFMTGLTSYGQSSKEDIDLIQSMYGKEKKELVGVYMSMPQSQSISFWAVYDQYEAERKAYGKARIALIDDYANVYDALTDEKAVELVNKKNALYNDFGKIQKKYFGKMTKIIGGKQAAKFIQLEDYLENSLRLSIQEEIPFIQEIEKSKVVKQQ